VTGDEFLTVAEAAAEGARRREISRQGGRSSPGSAAATRGEEAIGVVRSVGEGAEGRARRKQELTARGGSDGEMVPAGVRSREVIGEYQ
jgi:hypothetical protein